MAPIIEIKNIGKEYQITHQRGGYVALRDVLAGVAKNPFKFFKQKAKQAVGLAKKEDFWALRGINFSVEKGEVIGIIGHNGAGKSTLLKVLTGITPPTEGEIIMRGRIASLLEVGTGFHPELSGRENIFLNGAILGMKKKEIAEKFDQIVEFAGIGKFLDTPVKHYSSGMYVRLAFSVAAHLEPDILIIDEVLAVGDAEFQKKCLGKMEDITKKDGRTILFVSHNMEAIRTLCAKTVLLEKGGIAEIGDTPKVLRAYAGKLDNPSGNFEDKSEGIRISRASIGYKDGNMVIETDIEETDKLRETVLGFTLFDKDFRPVFGSNARHDKHIKASHIKTPRSKAKIIVRGPKLRSGRYYISLQLGDLQSDYWTKDYCLSLDISSGDDGSSYIGSVLPETEITIEPGSSREY